MKKTLLAFIFSLTALCGVAMAEDGNTYVLVSRATITGAATTVVPIPSGVWYSTWTCDLKLTGSPTSVVVRIEGNQGEDTTNFSPVGIMTITCTAAELTAGFCSAGAANSTARNLRANVVTLGGGSSPTVSVYCSGVKR